MCCCWVSVLFILTFMYRSIYIKTITADIRFSNLIHLTHMSIKSNTISQFCEHRIKRFAVHLTAPNKRALYTHAFTILSREIPDFWLEIPRVLNCASLHKPTLVENHSIILNLRLLNCAHLLDIDTAWILANVNMRAFGFASHNNPCL